LKGKPRRAAPPLTESNKTARTIYRWIFSWAQPSHCETSEEYLVSKALFLKFVQSNQVKDLFGSVFVESVVNFVRENVFPHEERFCYFKRHSLFHLETHTNCGHEGTNNGVKNCSSPVMPQNRLDRAIKTLNLNADVKAINTSIKLCQKTNQRKLWSDTPTSGFVTDVCESMLKTEWKCASAWIPHQVSKYRWLVIHHSETAHSNFNSWSDDDEDTDSDEEEKEDPISDNDGASKKFGPIPRFTRVYEVKVDMETNVFGCSCCNQERMGMPCRHIASVCLDDETILGPDPKGFPLTSIRIFWWNQYYLYGLSHSKDHQKSKQALIALAEKDTLGLPCPGRLDTPHTYACPEHVLAAYYKPATDRLLNYNSYEAIAATQKTRDRNNPNRLPQESVPAGLSQMSHLPDIESDGENWDHPMEELSDTEDYSHSRKVLSRHYNELSEAFNNSKAKETLEAEFMRVMNDFTVRARGSASVVSTSVGHRVSMLPASSKRRKTHGSHY
jgi:hypothetical protein